MRLLKISDDRMRIGIVRTLESVCRCAESIAQGLAALGHDALIVNSEEIEFQADDLACQCDFIIDHTDTFKGRGFFRALVRLLLESRGARIVGSDAKACFLADDKMASKARLSTAGIPTPPGILVRTKEFELPQWLEPPLVLKPAFEHMSRGLRLARNEKELHLHAADLLQRYGQPVLVETYLKGRELAVPVIAGPKGLEVLTILEWRLEHTGNEVLSETFKKVDPPEESMRPADLPLNLRERIEAFARKAFDALGLKDYARFDLRLTEDGTPYLLEANVTPSLEIGEAFARSARWSGLDYPTLIGRLLSSGLNRYGHMGGPERSQMTLDLPFGRILLDLPEGVHIPPPSSIDLAKFLDIRRDEKVLDLGCGSGLFSIVSAKLGAKEVVAVDIDPKALEATALNAKLNGVAARIQIKGGSWFEPLKENLDRFDVVIATPPQTPGPRPFGPRYGGLHGTDHLFAILEKVQRFLHPERGRLWMLAISLADPEGLWKRLEERFKEVRLVYETERFFTPEEYEAMEAGLFNHLLQLRSSGLSQFEQDSNGRWFFRNLFIRARGLR
ncbi:MAG: 50S ribosomal protein L11 methyltransferase [Desulfobacterota bacterium]|nr:50S ribosomal protein L11 methyltransferase [Thermodesulfobacteriota bacterium]